MGYTSRGEETAIQLTTLSSQSNNNDDQNEDIMRVVNRPASQRSKASVTSLHVFPLRTVTRENLKGLCAALWDWDMCPGCLEDKTCQNPTSCPWSQRSDRLMPFFDIYRRLTRGYVPEDFVQDSQAAALSCHEDLFELITKLRVYGRDTSREAFRKFVFEERGVPRGDQDRAIDLALRIMTMTSPQPSMEDELHSRVHNHTDLGSDPFKIEETFPVRVHPSLQETDRHAHAVKKGLQAHNLVQKAGLKLEKTDDLREHLKLDESQGVVKIFSWTSLLKENLLLPFTAHDRQDNTCAPPPLPRPLALETLHTLHLLFPPSSPKSQSLLRSLVSKSGFDPDILRFKTSGLSAFELGPEEREKVIKFGVWGSRLMDLYDEIENPKPRSGLDIWLERRSKSRHVMMATIAGVMAAVVLGVLGLGVGVFQAWISWQTWELEREQLERGG
ncbi:hypothetical protein QC761_405970 [Podospora bellae-mahoneyi]|uniref:Uncharacterized protein n=1 Tax=Podospora bellae-mahoneyi TaxID=2093777 RepID=A0ABR0FIR6_9PEZI|nr:hypothetical protein QC761_405970 [Podospora bellae-mahoneyi]